MKHSIVIPFLAATIMAGIFHPLPAAPVLRENPQRSTGTFNWAPVKIKDLNYVNVVKLEEFYQLEQEKMSESTIRLSNRSTEIHLTINSHSATINGVKYFLSLPVKNINHSPHLSLLDVTTLIDPVLRPGFIPEAKPFNTVVLDAGHGGADRGATKREAATTLNLAFLVKEKLTQKGYRVVLTRTKDITLPLKDRVDIINAQQNAIVISLHFNAGPKEVHGVETYLISATEPMTQASIALATSVHSRTIRFANDNHAKTNKKKNTSPSLSFKTADRGIRHAKFSLLKQSKHPAILIELGFLSHKQEAANIADKKYRSLLASGIVRGIDVYRMVLKK